MDPNLKQNIRMARSTKIVNKDEIQKYVYGAVREYGFYETIAIIQELVPKIMAEEMKKIQRKDVIMRWLNDIKDDAIRVILLYMIAAGEKSMTLEPPEVVHEPTNNLHHPVPSQMPALLTSPRESLPNANSTKVLGSNPSSAMACNHHENNYNEQFGGLSSLSEMSEEVQRKRQLVETSSRSKEAKRWKAADELNSQQPKQEPLSISIDESGGAMPEQISDVGSLQNSASSDDYSVDPYSPYTHESAMEITESANALDRVTVSPTQLDVVQESVETDKPGNSSSVGETANFGDKLGEAMVETKNTSQDSVERADSREEIDTASQRASLSPKEDNSPCKESSSKLTDEQKKKIESFLLMPTAYKTRFGITTKDQMVEHMIKQRTYYTRLKTTPHWKLSEVDQELDVTSYFETTAPDKKGEGKIHYPYSCATFAYLKDEVTCDDDWKHINYKNLQPGQIVWFNFEKCRYVGFIHNIYYDNVGVINVCCQEFVGSKGEPTAAWVKYEHVTPFDYDFAGKMCYWKNHNHAPWYYQNVAEAILHRGTPGYYEEFMPKKLFDFIVANEKYHPILAHAPERLLTAWFKYQSFDTTGYRMSEQSYSNFDNVFLDALDKVPKYDKNGSRRCAYVDGYCNTMLMAHYLKDGKDYPDHYEGGQNPSGLLIADHESLFPEKNHGSCTVYEYNTVLRKANKLVEDHTSYIMKYRLHLIDENEFNHERILNPPVIQQAKKIPKKGKNKKN